MSIDTRKILVICAGMGIHTRSALDDIARYGELDDALSLHALERRYADIDIKPEPFGHRQSWQSRNKGKLSKKQRRK